MPTKKTAAKKTAKITANFTANVPEVMMTECGHKKIYKKWGSVGAFYFLGFIGAAIYFVGKAVGFRMGALGILKAIVRPAFFVHGVLKFLWL